MTCVILAAASRRSRFNPPAAVFWKQPQKVELFFNAKYITLKLLHCVPTRISWQPSSTSWIPRCLEVRTRRCDESLRKHCIHYKPYKTFITRAFAFVRARPAPRRTTCLQTVRRTLLNDQPDRNSNGKRVYITWLAFCLCDAAGARMFPLYAIAFPSTFFDRKLCDHAMSL